MSKAQGTTAVEPTTMEALVAEAKMAAARKSAIRRGWDAITPELVTLVQADDERRIEGITAHYMRQFS